MRTFGIFILILIAAGCATRHSIYSDYQATLRETQSRAQARHTTVIFLVDGLGMDVTREMLSARELPRTAAFFKQLQTGQAIFPTLTYPNITSVLTGLPVDQHPVNANAVMIRGNEVNFENPGNRGLLNQMLAGKTYFSQLASEGRKSVSFSHSFHEGATANLATDLKSGLAYISRNYNYIDGKVLRGVERLFEDTAVERWPEFVFVHLAGYDALAHEKGPRSREALRYLKWLDAELDGVYSRLARAERSGHAVRAMMTADHGFETIRGHFPIESVMRGRGFRVVNQYRMATLHAEGVMDSRARQALFAGLARLPAVEAVVEAGYNGPRVYSRKPLSAPALRSLEAYFRSPLRPDAVVIAADGISFTAEGRGQHGGLKPSEMEVPMFLRGVSMPSGPVHLATRALVSLPSAPAVSGVAAASEESLGIAQSIEVSAPMTRASLQFDRGSETKTLTSSFTPGFELDWKQVWTDEFSTSLGYGARFYGFDEDAGRKAPSGMHEFRAGTGYRFSHSQRMSLGLSYDEEVLEDGSLWVPELEFGTRQRLFSMGFGDIGLKGGLGVLFPAEEYALGFRQKFGVHLESPVGTANLFGLGVLAEHFSQSTAGSRSRAGWSLGLGAFYEMTLN